MIALLRHLLDPAYLYAERTGPASASGAASALLLSVLAAGVALAWRRRRRSSPAASARPWPIVGGAFLVAGVLFGVARVAAGPLSARVWHLSALALAGAAALAVAVRRPLGRVSWLVRLVDAASARLDPQDPPLSRPATAGLAAVHIGGLAALLATGEAGWWLPALALACLAAAGWRRVEVLTPLLLAYAGRALRALVGGPLGVDFWPYLAIPYADPWSPWFDRRATLLLGAATTLGVSAVCGMRRLGLHGAARRRALALALAGGCALWFAAAVAVHRSYGATGSDAFCYLQMAADLAHGGSAEHAFPLAPLLWASGLPAWPAVPVGYHPPDALGRAVTVWPIGWPIMLAGLIRLGGEGLALWGAPLSALLAAALAWLLAGEMDPEGAPVAGALAAAILLTSREGALRALVPMADAAAQMLSVATILCLWRARRRDRLAWSAVAGLLFAWAYWVRHPLLPLGLAAIPAYGGAPWTWRRRLAHLGAFGAAALAGALPDLAHHRQAFGSLWIAESPEWALLSWRHIVPSAATMLRDGWLRREEFGYLAPFILMGIGAQWRTRRRRAAAATLWAGLGGVLLLNLAYGALRLRDLLSLFPWAALWSAWGAQSLWRWAAAAGAGRLRRALAVLAIAAALAARAAPTIALPWRQGVWTFGHVTAAQRTAFDALASALPPNAVVATGLDAGAVMRYTGRDAVRPGPWSDEELAAFVALLAEQRRPLYLLVDGEEMEDVLARRAGALAVEPVGAFDLPMMGRGGQWQEGPATLYVVVSHRMA